MGFEVVYYYKELIDEKVLGVYSEEVKSKTSKIGKATEDISFETLASKILSQLARRNILIVNFEIFEFAKKKVNFKEANDGIIIKNKKYKFDGKVNMFTDINLEEIDSDETDDQEDTEIEKKENEKQKDVFPCKLNSQSSNKKPIRYEYYDPEVMALHKAKQKGLKFTQGKKYPIFSEQNMGSAIVYKTIDDSNNEVSVSSEYFSAAAISGSSNSEVDLWSRYNVENEVPHLR
jgi:hypothetical protein